MQPTSTVIVPSEPRWLGRVEAAMYVGVSVDEFLTEVEQGVWPGPQRRTETRELWDRKAIDSASDRLTQIQDQPVHDPLMELLDVEETAALLRLNPDTVRRIPRSELPVCRPGKKNLYLRSDVLAYATSKAPSRHGQIDEGAISKALSEVRSGR